MNSILKVYAAYNCDKEVQYKSSSGGIFSELAKFILRQKGVVYGVAMSDDYSYAYFRRVEEESDLEYIRGSKYLQARIGDTLIRAENDLKNQRMVLFSGTPCQVNALRKYLGREYKNLICIDVVCHGVPSEKFWKSHLAYVKKKKKFENIHINFRDKRYGWNNFGISYNQVKNSFFSLNDDSYMKMFLSDYNLRPSCYECQAREKRLSDISLADFWGIKRILPKMYNKWGVSLVIVRSEKGANLFCKSKEIEKAEVKYEDAIKYNPADIKSPAVPQQRALFYEDFNVETYDKLLKKYMTTSIKIKLKEIIRRVVFLLERK